MNYISRTHKIVLLAIILTLGVLLLLGERFTYQEGSLQKKTTPPIVTTPSPQSIPTEESFLSTHTEPSAFGITLPRTSTTSSESRLSYTEALELYKSNILQFNDNCQLAINDRSFRLGNEVMVDNRAPQSRTIAVGSASVVVGPYDYGFIILRERGLQVPVRCEKQENVASLIVQ